MKLTDRQQEKAIGVRQLLSPKGKCCKACGQSSSLVSWSDRLVCPDEGNVWFAFVDCTRAIAKIIDGLDEVQEPGEIKKAFNAAWRSYIDFWGHEHKRLLCQALGNDAMLVDRVKEHKNGQRIINRILDRIKESNGGTISTGINAASVDIVDILQDEMGDEWME